MQKNPQLVAKVIRGENLESVHYGSIAVVDEKGKLIYSVGDADMSVQTRSSIKPFQVLPLLTTGAFKKYGFSQKQLAIMCGSHNGSDEHREVVLSNLVMGGNKPEHLQCGTHWPIEMQREQKYPLNEEDKDPVRHNCSGKHSGFLALARFLGEDPEEYLNPESKTQIMVKEAIADVCEYPAIKMTPCIDGCSAPNYAMPLKNLALGFVKLAVGTSKDNPYFKALNMVREAMMAYPAMVAGKYRFDLHLMESLPNKVVCKVGAEGVQGIGLVDNRMGIAVKIHDGASRARGPVCTEILRQLDILTKVDDFPYMKNRLRPEIRNNTDKLTGYVEPDFELKSWND